MRFIFYSIRIKMTTTYGLSYRDSNDNTGKLKNYPVLCKNLGKGWGVGGGDPWQLFG